MGAIPIVYVFLLHLALHLLPVSGNTTQSMTLSIYGYALNSALQPFAATLVPPPWRFAGGHHVKRQSTLESRVSDHAPSKLYARQCPVLMGSALLAVCLFRSIAFEPEEIAVMSDRPTTEMPHVGIECFGTGQCKQSSTKRTRPSYASQETTQPNSIRGDRRYGGLHVVRRLIVVGNHKADTDRGKPPAARRARNLSRTPRPAIWTLGILYKRRRIRRRQNTGLPNGARSQAGPCSSSNGPRGHALWHGDKAPV